eukprot:4296165-Pleurochrysis_carterae.AAC.1
MMGSSARSKGEGKDAIVGGEEDDGTGNGKTRSGEEGEAERRGSGNEENKGVARSRRARELKRGSEGRDS